jgi:deoxycytidylate deaminase
MAEGKSRQGVVIGLTGSFGSGCSTVGQILAETGEFHVESLSAAIKKEAQKRGIEPERRVLQDLGDELRKPQGRRHVLARKAIQAAHDNLGTRALVLDGIRNLGEVEWLRQRYSRFYLIAVDASRDTRYGRLKGSYGKNEAVFDEDDRRDSLEPFAYGQQVELCVDAADVLIINEADMARSKSIKQSFAEKVLDYVGLMVSPGKRPPTHVELLMHYAYSASLRSSCLKRQVGAVIATPDHSVIASGYNEVPPGEESCRVRFGQCYRDKVRNEYIATLRVLQCGCGEKITPTHVPEKEGAEVHCRACGRDLTPLFRRTKALDLCQSLHAEETALLQGARLGGMGHQGMVLYTTTFPCLLCAKKIVHTGIKEVIYVEPYPVKEAAQSLSAADVTATRFEGVKSPAFHRLFKPGTGAEP